MKAFQLARLPRTWAGALAIPLIWFYTGATGWQASAIRSTIMSSVIIVGWILKRPNNLLNSLAASAILILLWQPEQLFQAGFQLSFILLLGFAIWPVMADHPWPNPTLYLRQTSQEEFAREPDRNRWGMLLARIYERATGRDPFLPADLRPAWRKQLDRPLAFLLGGINISLASLLSSLPVIALYFNLISYSSLVANLVIVPISGITLFAALVSWGLAWFPIASIAANWVSWATMWFMVWFCRWLESFSWTYQYVQSPSALTIFACYATLVALVNGWLKIRRILIPIATLVLVSISVSLWRETTTTRITMLPGAGAIFIDRPWSGEDLLVDCGRDREVATMVKPFLHSRGVNALDQVLLSHGDAAHIDGYPRLKTELRVRETISSSAKSRSRIYRSIVRELEDTSAPWQRVMAGDQLRGWKILHPDKDYPHADDETVVLTRTIEGHKILLLSDLGPVGQERLLNSNLDLHSEILFCGIGSDGRAPKPDLLEKIAPQYIIIADNHGKSAKAVQQLRGGHWEVHATSEEGAVTVEIQTGRLKVKETTR